MRLFIAILFNTHTIDRIVSHQKRIRSSAVRGNFSHRDNLHLTLAFIGERPLEDLVEIGSIVKHVELEKFTLQIDHLGYFGKRNHRDIWWMGMAPQAQLDLLRNTLVDQLLQAGFPIDRTPYNAHITLGREVLLKDPEDKRRLAGSVSPIITTEAKRVSLMESVRLDGRLVYREIMGKYLR